MHKHFSYTLFAAAVALSSCGSSDSSQAGNEAPATAQAMPAQVVHKIPQLVAVSASPGYPNATITLGNVSATPVGKDSAKVSFAFGVKDYELKAQTADTGSKLCNNSAQGQHIHFILDNAPYKALYEPKNEVTLANGTEHYVMAFLSRSYHESVKTPSSATLIHFRIDDKGKLVRLDDPKTPMLFYSRPKGDYIGKDTANVLLDFFIWNGKLTSDGYKVQADILTSEGENNTFTFMAWEPKFITNLPMGKNKITLTLIGPDGKQPEGPNTKVEREINLALGEPMK